MCDACKTYEDISGVFFCTALFSCLRAYQGTESWELSLGIFFGHWEYFPNVTEDNRYMLNSGQQANFTVKMKACVTSLIISPNLRFLLERIECSIKTWTKMWWCFHVVVVLMLRARRTDFFASEITKLDARICPGAVRASPHRKCQDRTCQTELVPLSRQLQGSQLPWTSA